MVRFRVECGTREWGEQMIPGEKVGEWRRRAITLLNAREQEHAQCVCIDGALIDEEDEMADWINPKTMITLPREQDQDKSWRDDAEEAAPPERKTWPPMTQEEISNRLAGFTHEDQHSDDEMIRRRAYKPAGRRGEEMQQYRIECERRTRWEPIEEGDTVESWLARISRKTGEQWQGMWHKGVRILNTEIMELRRPGVNVRRGECLDGDWYPGRKRPKTEPPPPPPPPSRRILIEVPDLPDEELEASDQYLRFKVWKGKERADFWIPVETIEDEQMKITRAVGNRFAISKNKDYWWLTYSGGAPVRGGLKHEDEFEWNEGDEEEFHDYLEWKRETEERKTEPVQPGAPEPAPSTESLYEPVETRRRFVRVQEGTDAELESQGCRRITV